MRRTLFAGLIAVGVSAGAGLVWASNTTHVSNPEPVVSASMTLDSAIENASVCPFLPNSDTRQTLFHWTVSGKLKPSFRGRFSDIKLVCNTFAGIEQGGAPTLTFPRVCDDNDVDNAGCHSVPVTGLDACGNFTFPAEFCGTSPQLDGNHVCTFVAHLDGTKSPQSCNKALPPIDQLPDPNGSGPCGGGLCPEN